MLARPPSEPQVALPQPLAIHQVLAIKPELASTPVRRVDVLPRLLGIPVDVLKPLFGLDDLEGVGLTLIGVLLYDQITNHYVTIPGS